MIKIKFLTSVLLIIFLFNIFFTVIYSSNAENIIENDKDDINVTVINNNDNSIESNLSIIDNNTNTNTTENDNNSNDNNENKEENLINEEKDANNEITEEVVDSTEKIESEDAKDLIQNFFVINSIEQSEEESVEAEQVTQSARTWSKI